MDFEKRKVYAHDQEIHLAPIEYKMLTLLVNNAGKVLPHHYIQQEVGIGYRFVENRAFLLVL